MISYDGICDMTELNCFIYRSQYFMPLYFVLTLTAEAFHTQMSKFFLLIPYKYVVPCLC